MNRYQQKKKAEKARGIDFHSVMSEDEAKEVLDSLPWDKGGFAYDELRNLLDHCVSAGMEAGVIVQHHYHNGIDFPSVKVECLFEEL